MFFQQFFLLLLFLVKLRGARVMLPAYVCDRLLDGVASICDNLGVLLFLHLALPGDESRDLVVLNERHAAVLPRFTNPNEPPVTKLFTAVIEAPRESPERIVTAGFWEPVCYRAWLRSSIFASCHGRHNHD